MYALLNRYIKFFCNEVDPKNSPSNWAETRSQNSRLEARQCQYGSKYHPLAMAGLLYASLS